MNPDLFLGRSLTEWTAILAFATLALALGTFVTVIVTANIARTDRQRDDQLRKDDAAYRQRQTDAERRDREDVEARQVLVRVEARRPDFAASMAQGRNDVNNRVKVSTPRQFPIKQVYVRIAGWLGGELVIREPGYRPDEPYIDEDRLHFGFWAYIPPELELSGVIVRFVDRHDNLHYQWRHYTKRFPAGTEWLAAFTQLDEWIRMGAGVGQQPGDVAETRPGTEAPGLVQGRRWRPWRRSRSPAGR